MRKQRFIGERINRGYTWRRDISTPGGKHGAGSRDPLQGERHECGGCVAKATEALSKLPGYVSAEFDLKSGTAVVKGGVDPQIVINALTKVGYPAEVDEG